ncbi:hypothetical protein B0H10DRAFT_2188705 [Mycena sp. CBHHK59/15]|nr:hypothetical protein B0H10DRAFT_2188705 [Mycena sp. CBHHK59/15]
MISWEPLPRPAQPPSRLEKPSHSCCRANAASSPGLSASVDPSIRCFELLPLISPSAQFSCNPGRRARGIPHSRAHSKTEPLQVDCLDDALHDSAVAKNKDLKKPRARGATATILKKYKLPPDIVTSLITIIPITDLGDRPSLDDRPSLGDRPSGKVGSTFISAPTAVGEDDVRDSHNMPTYALQVLWIDGVEGNFTVGDEEKIPGCPRRRSAIDETWPLIRAGSFFGDFRDSVFEFQEHPCAPCRQATSSTLDLALFVFLNQVLNAPTGHTTARGGQ